MCSVVAFVDIWWWIKQKTIPLRKINGLLVDEASALKVLKVVNTGSNSSWIKPSSLHCLLDAQHWIRQYEWRWAVWLGLLATFLWMSAECNRNSTSEPQLGGKQSKKIGHCYTNQRVYTLLPLRRPTLIEANWFPFTTCWVNGFTTLPQRKHVGSVQVVVWLVDCKVILYNYINKPINWQQQPRDYTNLARTMELLRFHIVLGRRIGLWVVHWWNILYHCKSRKPVYEEKEDQVYKLQDQP